MNKIAAWKLAVPLQRVLKCSDRRWAWMLLWALFLIVEVTPALVAQSGVFNKKDTIWVGSLDAVPMRFRDHVASAIQRVEENDPVLLKVQQSIDPSSIRSSGPLLQGTIIVIVQPRDSKRLYIGVMAGSGGVVLDQRLEPMPVTGSSMAVWEGPIGAPTRWGVLAAYDISRSISLEVRGEYWHASLSNVGTFTKDLVDQNGQRLAGKDVSRIYELDLSSARVSASVGYMLDDGFLLEIGGSLALYSNQSESDSESVVDPGLQFFANDYKGNPNPSKTRGIITERFRSVDLWGGAYARGISVKDYRCSCDLAINIR